MLLWHGEQRAGKAVDICLPVTCHRCQEEEGLRSFDFSGVTEGDRAAAAAWQRTNAKRKGAGKGARGAGGGPPCPSE
uniref:Uncharacterized protein n=1 Tax=Apteryx owenii TaxID=8824 RepID=A0A8B9QJ78_APTOW